MSHPTSRHLTSALTRREHSRRRAAVLGIGVLLVLSTSPVFGHHLIGSASEALNGRDHLGFVCLVALHLLLAPVHGLFHGLLIGGVAYAVWDRARAWRRWRRALGALEWEAVKTGHIYFWPVQTVGLAPNDVRVVAGLPVPAFTAGWVRPRVYLAADLAARLSEVELVAVLAHEAAHVARRDPIRLSLLRFLSCVLFWLPVLRRIAADLADEAEIEADDHAARRYPLALASALLALAGGESPLAAGALTRPGFGGSESASLLERRVRRLAEDDTPLVTHVTRRSLVGAAAALMVVWVSGVVVAHPLPAASATHAFADHCEHHRQNAFTHLFCLYSAVQPSQAFCPHARV
jgi:Zn-dependent protease with chaperone function